MSFFSIKYLTVMVDKCSKGWSSKNSASEHCLATIHLSSSSDKAPWWGHSGVLQIGGLAQNGNLHERLQNHSILNGITRKGFKGCLSDLRINESVSIIIVKHLIQTVSNKI